MRRLSNNCLFFNGYYDLLITFCSYVIIFLFIAFSFVFYFVKFDFVSSYNGFVIKDGEYCVVLYINDNGLQSIKKDVLVIDKVKYDYSIIKISDEYVISDSGPVRMVYLSFNLSDDEKIINNVMKLNFVSKKTIFKYLKERLL